MIAIALAALALPTVFGLQLGAAPQLPECERMAEQYPTPGIPAPYLSAQSRECLEHDLAPAAGIDQGMIYFPPDAMPAIASFNWISARLIGGKLEEIGANTLDYNHADYIVAQLSVKFGKPDSDRRDEAEIESIALPSRTVVWNRPGYRVEYRSIGERIDAGHLLIQTDAAIAERAAEHARVKAQETPL